MPAEPPDPVPTLGPTWVDALIWMAAGAALLGTLWLSLSATTEADRLLGSDKVGHAAAYAVDTFLLLLATVWRPGRPQRFVAWALPIVLGVLLLGGALELGQAAVDRDADAADWLADAVGVAGAAAIFAVLRRSMGASRPARDA